MSKLIIIRGAPGVGKTAVANYLHNHADTKTVLLPKDTFIVDIIKDHPDLRLASKNVYKYAIREFLHTGSTVICDGAFYSKHWFDSFDKIVTELTPSTYYFFLSAQLDTAVQRARTRKKAKILDDKYITDSFPDAKSLDRAEEYIIDTEGKSVEEVAVEIARITGLELSKNLEKRQWYSDSFLPAE